MPSVAMENGQTVLKMDLPEATGLVALLGSVPREGWDMVNRWTDQLNNLPDLIVRLNAKENS